MQLRLLKKLSVLFVVCVLWSVMVLFVFLFLPQRSFAYSTFYFYPQRTSVSVGETKQIQLRLNTDQDAVNALTAYITYPASFIDVKLVSSSSVFPIVAQHSFTNGFIEISEGSIEPVKGDVLIATLSLTGKKEGEVAMSFGEGSAVPTYDNNTDSLSLARSIGGLYTVKNLAKKVETRKVVPKSPALRYFFFFR